MMTKQHLYTFGLLSLLVGMSLLAGAAPNEREILGQDGMTMVLIPAGKFQMGRGDSRAEDDEKPVHTVYVDAFYMDVHEVTNAQYKKFVEANPLWEKKDDLMGDLYLPFWAGNRYPPGQGNHPVQVHWLAAMAYAQWAGKRLPTEAEWEKAARGGLKGLKYPWGNAVDASKANWNNAIDATGQPSGDGSLEGPTLVKNYAPNAYGLYDMAGNVAEWCLDEYDEDYYKYSPPQNPISIHPKRGKSITDAIVVGTHMMHLFKLVLQGRETDALAYQEEHLDEDVFDTPHVFRGGSWKDISFFFSIGARDGGSVEDSFDNDNHNDIGFRCVKPVNP